MNKLVPRYARHIRNPQDVSASTKGSPTCKTTFPCLSPNSFSVPIIPCRLISMHTPAQQQCPNPQLSRLQTQQSDAPCENTLDSGHTKQRAQLIQWSAWLCSLVRYVHVHLFYRSRSLQPLNRTRTPGNHHVRFPTAPAGDGLAAWEGESRL